jgi:hypothetical protein
MTTIQSREMFARSVSENIPFLVEMDREEEEMQVIEQEAIDLEMPGAIRGPIIGVGSAIAGTGAIVTGAGAIAIVESLQGIHPLAPLIVSSVITAIGAISTIGGIAYIPAGFATNEFGGGRDRTAGRLEIGRLRLVRLDGKVQSIVQERLRIGGPSPEVLELGKAETFFRRTLSRYNAIGQVHVYHH